MKSAEQCSDLDQETPRIRASGRVFRLQGEDYGKARREAGAEIDGIGVGGGGHRYWRGGDLRRGTTDRDQQSTRSFSSFTCDLHAVADWLGQCWILPGSGITQATQLLQEQDRIIRSFPEVDSVFGVVGRSDSSTDNAPLDMYDTTVMLKPREHWRPGMTYDKLIAEMDSKLQFPCLSNTWTTPVENRLDIQLTGIKAPIGIKIEGRTVEGIQAAGSRIEQLLSRLPGRDMEALPA